MSGPIPKTLDSNCQHHEIKTNSCERDSQSGESRPHDGQDGETRDGQISRMKTTADEPPPDTGVATRVSTAGPVHSVFSRNQKRFIVFMAAWGGFFSAVSASIYFPALNSLAADLKVSNSLINLTITSYMVGFPTLPR